MEKVNEHIDDAIEANNWSVRIFLFFLFFLYFLFLNFQVIYFLTRLHANLSVPRIRRLPFQIHL